MMHAGLVDPAVGLATHYHTDWVRPYWSDSLEKIAVVDTHLFFRWPGYWGTPGAFRGAVRGQDPVEALLAAIRSEEHTSELQSLMRISYAVFCLQKKKKKITMKNEVQNQHTCDHK